MPASNSISGELTHPQQEKLTGDTMKLAIEKFSTKVQMKYMAESEMDGYFEVIDLKGTNHASNDGLGGTTLAALVAGVAPTGTKIERGRGKVYVKVPVVARSTFGVLEDVQDNIGVRGKTSEIQGEQLATFYDEVILAKCMEASLETDATKKKVSEYELGKNVELAADDDELDGLKLESAINEVAVDIQKKMKRKPKDFVLKVGVEQYNALARNEKLLNKEINDPNGGFARREVQMASGLPIETSYNLPSAVNDAHIMGAEYNVTADMARCVALIISKDALLVARSIPLTSKVWWNEDNKSWYVDSYMAFGCAPDRYESCGSVSKYSA